ncbi:sensor histidine kinase, partial [Candidatus Parcubacteria bacterium]
MSGYASGAVFSSAPYMPAFNGYFFATLIPITCAVFYYGGHHAYLLGTLMLVFTYASWMMARNIHRMVTDQYETDLREELSRAALKISESKISALKTMAGAVAHNFNNSLAAAVGWLGLMRQHAGNPEKARKAMLKLEQALDRSISQAQAMLDYSNANFRTPTKFSLTGVVRDVLSSIQEPEVSLLDEIYECPEV